MNAIILDMFAYFELSKEPKHKNSLHFPKSETQCEKPLPKMRPISFKSQNGVPTRNNRIKYREGIEKYAKMLPKALEPIAHLLEKKRARNVTSSTEQHRMETIEQFHFICKQNIFTIEDVAYRFNKEPIPELVEFLGLLNPSAATLMWVVKALWGVSILKIGTEKHRDLLDKVGCLMLTEIGHGSNVLGIETQSNYDQKTREFIINSPSLTSAKCWIGGSAEHATHGVVFAQLMLNGKSLGPHLFVVQIRDEMGNIMPGVEITDLGRKQGLNGVDNGIVCFKHMRIAYDNLLDRYLEITPEGAYKVKGVDIPVRKLVYTYMSQFVRGRQVIALASIASLKFLSSIFYLYPPLSMSKPLHTQLMIDYLCKAWAMEFSKPIFLSNRYINDHYRASLAKSVYSEIGMKAFLDTVNWYRHPAYRLVMLAIEDYRWCASATQTYEGANVLLLQLGAKGIAKELQKWFADLKSGKIKAYKKIFQTIYHWKNPLFRVNREVFVRAQLLAKKLIACPKEKRMELFNSKLQMDAIELSKLYTHALMMESFMKEASKKKEPYWGSLCRIYCEKACSELLNGKMPYLKKDRKIVAENIQELVCRFGFKLEWIDAIIPPPEKSVPFDQTPPTLYGASL